MSASGSNFISEWYGVRLYPSASGASGSIDILRNKCCPFLSDTLATPTSCVKRPNSAGVCTITTTKAGARDWIVCPYRALERRLIHEVARKIFSDSREEIPVYPVVQLQDKNYRASILERAEQENVYIFFQDKLGGEINVSGSSTTPELSFDITIIECRSNGQWLVLKRYGFFEVQTMDFHGSYKHAVNALEAAIDLHSENFEEQVEKNQEWLGRKIEGPNIANVFKRTIYQLILKFGLAGKDHCCGVVLGLPEAVWKSWAPHFGGLEWADKCEDKTDNSWIFVLSPEQNPTAAYAGMEILKKIQVEEQRLVQQAFTIVPEEISEKTLPGIFGNILRRTRLFYENTRTESPEVGTTGPSI